MHAFTNGSLITALCHAFIAMLIGIQEHPRFEAIPCLTYIGVPSE